jgi:hypothetical protein
MFEGLFAASDKHLGRIGSPIVAGGVGGGAGAGIAHLMGKSMPIGAAIGAVAGVAGSEAGRALFCDKKALAELQLKELQVEERELRDLIAKLEATPKK